MALTTRKGCVVRHNRARFAIVAFVLSILAGTVTSVTLTTPPASASTPSLCEFDEANTLVTTTACLQVSKTTDVNPVGETITVKGFNYTPNPPATSATRPPLTGKFAGVYVVVNKFPDVWQPSLGGSRPSQTTNLETRWGVLAEDLATIGGESRGGIVVSPEGTFETTVTVRAEWDSMPTTGTFGIYTFGGGGAIIPDFERSVALTFTPSKAPRIALASNPAQPEPDQPFSLEVLVNPDEAEGELTLSGSGVTAQTSRIEDGIATFSVPSTPGGLYTWQIAFTPDEPLLFDARTVSFSFAVDDGTGTALNLFDTSELESGYLRWGVKSTFRSYVTGPIAKGSITTSEAGRAGSEFLFGQAQPVLDGASWSQVPYRGAVTFRGHDGLMNVTLANPRITRVDERTATLSVDYAGSRVSLARLDLSRASQSVSNGLVTYQNSPATLLSTGTSVFSFQGSGFYAAGDALDPVTFSIGAVAAALGDTVIDSYVPPEPEFTTENGLFAQLASVEGACTVADASMTWGIKESFRSYVSGAIAKGEWQVADGARYETPEFGFSHSEGSLSTESLRGLLRFAGLVNFTGHDGLLDVSLSNPVLGIESDAQATLYLTFEGQTMDGVATSESDIPFARVDLSSAVVTRDGRSVTVTNAPALLTAEGATALGSYQAGDQMDPVSFTVLTGLDCAASPAGVQGAEVQSVAGGNPPAVANPAAGLGFAAVAALIGLAVGGSAVWFAPQAWRRLTSARLASR